MTEARTPAHVGLGCEESKSLMSRHQETVAKLGGQQQCRNSRIGRQDHALLWVGLHSAFRSPRAGIRQTFIQAAVSLFPVTRAYFDWWTRVQTFKSEGIKFLLGGL